MGSHCSSQSNPQPKLPIINIPTYENIKIVFENGEIYEGENLYKSGLAIALALRQIGCYNTSDLIMTTILATDINALIYTIQVGKTILNNQPKTTTNL